MFTPLQQQHLIELIRLRETEAALEFAQTHLAEQGEESRDCLTEMERTLALLAFDNPEESPFGDLLNMMQRQKVSDIRIHPLLYVQPFSQVMEYLQSCLSVDCHSSICCAGIDSAIVRQLLYQTG